jgi:hypothetical protein
MLQNFAFAGPGDVGSLSNQLPSHRGSPPSSTIPIIISDELREPDIMGPVFVSARRVLQPCLGLNLVVDRGQCPANCGHGTNSRIIRSSGWNGKISSLSFQSETVSCQGPRLVFTRRGTYSIRANGTTPVVDGMKRRLFFSPLSLFHCLVDLLPGFVPRHLPFRPLSKKISAVGARLPIDVRTGDWARCRRGASR